MRSLHTTTALQAGRVAVDRDEAGAVLYGAFSFTVSGSIQPFIHWLNQSNHPYGRILSKWSPGSREFSAAWMYLGNNDPQGFYELQEVYQLDLSTCAS